MSGGKTRARDPAATKLKLVEAASDLIRRQGFTATTVDHICDEAGVTKGAFFHHFKTKEDIGLAALDWWCRGRVVSYQEAIGGVAGDPLVQLNHFFDGLIASVRNPPGGVLACLLGMMSQELSDSHGEIRETCGHAFAGWTAFVTAFLVAAKRVHPVRIEFEPAQVAWMLNSLWQGSLLIAKVRRDPGLVVQNLEQARTYVNALFDLPELVSERN